MLRSSHGCPAYHLASTVTAAAILQLSYTVRTGALENPQNAIVGVRYSFTTETLRFRCVGKQIERRPSPLTIVL